MSLLKYHKLSGESENASTVHFIETSPSVLRQVPWILYREQKVCINEQDRQTEK